MASATVTHRPLAQPTTGAFLHTFLPLLLLLPFVLVYGVAAVLLVARFMGFNLLRDVGFLRWAVEGLLGDQVFEQDLVLQRLQQPFRPLGFELPLTTQFWWLLLLSSILFLGFLYAGWMYFRDGRTIGAPWAIFLATVRCTVYLILAAVFLLPALQSFEVKNYHSRVVVLFDVSPSMVFTRDGVPRAGTRIEDLPTRQDQVIRLCTSEQVAFLKRLEEKNPVYCYRFGSRLDEDYLLFDNGRQWTRTNLEQRQHDAAAADKSREDKEWLQKEPWAAWLKPNLKSIPGEDLNDDDREQFRKQLEFDQRRFSTTNVGAAALAALNREINSMAQALVIVTDGRSTESASGALQELTDRARAAKIPIIFVGIGEDRPQIKIEITDLLIPAQARPEDKFRASVEINGEGLADKDIPVFLDITHPKGEDLFLTNPKGEQILLGKKITLQPREAVKFKPGAPPHAQAEFAIDAAELARAAGHAVEPNSKLEIGEGELKFIARVPRDPQEIFLEAEHVSEPATMRVIKRPLRILLFAGAPMRDYQFVRTLLIREKEKAELSIFLQPAPGQTLARSGRVQDVPPERLLTSFPTELETDEAKEKTNDRLYNLASYDLIMAFDPDWGQLSPEQLKMVEQWVQAGGGLIAVGGPVNTLQLARPGSNRDKLKPILDIYPVILQDSRIQEFERPTNDPWRLHFPGASDEMEFLKLDESNPNDPLAGWEEFFTGGKDAGPQTPLVNGIFNYYPVERAKDGSIVIATFTDPRARLVHNGSEQPYLVSMGYGSGRVVWLGSGEIWRLRHYKEAFPERFWTKLTRYTGSGNLKKLNRRINLVMGRNFTANNFVRVDAQIFDRNASPIAQDAAPPEVSFKLPPGVTDDDLAKQNATHRLAPNNESADWNGWFSNKFLVKYPGEYGIEVKIPGTSETVAGKFIVKEANPELDNTRPDFEQMYWRSSEANDVLARVDEKTGKELKERLQRPKLGQQPTRPDLEEVIKDKDTPRLYFDPSNADLIPSCMTTVSDSKQNKGPIDSLWDKEFAISLEWASILLSMLTGVLALGALVLGVLAVVMLFRGQPAGGLVTPLLAVGVLLLVSVPVLVLTLWWLWWAPDKKPVEVSIVLLVTVGFLSLEWMTRKLLRLA